MQLYAFGINHQTAPLEVREKIAFSAEGLTSALRDLVGHEPVREAAIISTCNRTELYCNAQDPDKAVSWLAGYHQIKAGVLEPYLYSLPRERAVKHAFRVASGLDSMVLGEAQILGQMKQAVRSAEKAGTLGLVLHKLFQQTFSVAKEVRTRTDIGASSVSMAAAAVRLAERIFPAIAEQKVLFVGAGEMIELTARHFAAQKPRGITFANRTVERAQLLAIQFGGQAVSINDLAEVLAAHDIVVSSTASPLPIIGKGMVERALKARRHRPILMVDLAVPRDVEAEVAKMDDVFLYSVDELGRVVQEGRDARAAAVSQAELIIDEKVVDFMQWLGGREAVPTIRALRDQAERARRHQVDRALRMLRKGEPAEQVLEMLSQSLTNKLMHAPTAALHEGTQAERGELQRMVERIYQVRAKE
ncbi:MAG: glutamyl-tRNA reductase [Burkholderiaceae bacterium]|nr:glutamyl-tRNA reductase [Burkholderiaceae bacterium]